MVTTPRTTAEPMGMRPSGAPWRTASGRGAFDWDPCAPVVAHAGTTAGIVRPSGLLGGGSG